MVASDFEVHLLGNIALGGSQCDSGWFTDLQLRGGYTSWKLSHPEVGYKTEIVSF